jgi:nucleotide-binding universal stress UspA family protein
MTKVLLVLSTTRESPASIDRALGLASDHHAELIVLFVLDEDLPLSIVEHLTERGFIGNRPSEQLYEAILKEYEIQAEKKTAEIAARAAAQGTPCRSIRARGSFLDETLRVLEEEKVDVAVLTRRRRSNLSRFLFGSAVADLVKRAPCPVEIVDED